MKKSATESVSTIHSTTASMSSTPEKSRIQKQKMTPSVNESIFRASTTKAEDLSLEATLRKAREEFRLLRALWTERKRKGTQFVTEIINSRSKLSLIGADIRDQRLSFVDGRIGEKEAEEDNPCPLSLHRKIEKQHVHLFRIQGELETIHDEMIEAVKNVESSWERQARNRSSANAKGRSYTFSTTRTCVSLLYELESMYARSLCAKHTVCTELLSKTANHDYMITLVATWDCEPSIDETRLDEIFDVLAEI